MELVALLSTGKGTWGQVSGLLSRGEWENIILVGEDFVKQRFQAPNAEFVTVDFSQNITAVIEDLIAKLKPRIHGTEVALSIASGEGKEHMALISALLRIPVGVKFVVLTKDGVILL
ncbi:hypothetical protein COS75_00560 [Candidatus Pacearchaeota archaeon CG06_land_8_20_14_3_00_35_12]|nr:MAG: hypothetical protein COS75_00560 [Candidatus Pacearchaeota archaeon CG06_land_8_20_14_3_00_35_12]